MASIDEGKVDLGNLAEPLLGSRISIREFE